MSRTIYSAVTLAVILAAASCSNPPESGTSENIQTAGNTAVIVQNDSANNNPDNIGGNNNVGGNNDTNTDNSADNSSAEAASTNADDIATSAASDTSSKSQRPASAILDPPIENLPSASAVLELQFRGHNGEELCRDRHRLETGAFIPDYAERELGSPVPLISQDLAEIYALGAAGLTLKSYITLSMIRENPQTEQLLCISRLISQPRLETEWNYLSYLLRENKSAKGMKLPTQLTVAAIRSGEAIILGCLPPKPYGDIYDFANQPEGRQSNAPDYSFVFEANLAWIGARWRIQTLQDFPETNCEKLPQIVEERQQSLQANTNLKKDNWILAEKSWNWTEKEILQWLDS